MLFSPGLYLPMGKRPAAAGGGSTVTLNAGGVGTETYQANGASLNYTGLTIAAGTKTALLVVLIRASSALDTSTGVALTWDNGGSNQTMTLLVSHSVSGGARLAQVWGLRAPTTGNKTLHVAWTNVAADNFVAGIAFDNVLQTNDAAAFPHTGLFSSGGTFTVASSTGNRVVGAYCDTNNGAAVLETPIFDDFVNSSIANGAASYLSGAASVTAGMVTGIMTAGAGVDIQAG